ncbi:carbonate dehydratase [Shewanella sp. TC10]|uniref:carbonate dehydratase n=1 Tax=Shewanella sp. TC10 TaxID=1419739 RepID=UPI00129D5116|nr:carbonate dehydratase [Shewanella sp. TC10]
MKLLKPLFDNNRRWAERINEEDPDFFKQLAEQQNPEYLWIGCSDSRVPSNQIIDLMPGEVFVHRNIANMVIHTDLNCLSVIQYAVEVLKVKHIMVVGHYGCGGVKASMSNERFGLIDNWLGHLKDIYRLHQADLNELDEEQRFNRLCELNVMEQVANVTSTSIVQDAWDRGQEVAVHGWIYGINNGLLTDLDVTVFSEHAKNNSEDSAV